VISIKEIPSILGSLLMRVRMIW
jgi:dynein heavy chain